MSVLFHVAACHARNAASVILLACTLCSTAAYFVHASGNVCKLGSVFLSVCVGQTFTAFFFFSPDVYPCGNVNCSGGWAAEDVHVK